MRRTLAYTRYSAALKDWGQRHADTALLKKEPLLLAEKYEEVAAFLMSYDRLYKVEELLKTALDLRRREEAASGGVMKADDAMKVAELLHKQARLLVANGR